MSKPTSAKSSNTVEHKLHVVQKVIAGDTYLVMSDSAAQPEDEFAGLYYDSSSSSNLALQPPFDPKVLARLPNQNNILSQCVEAMEVNIDGTGHEFVPAEEGVAMNEAEYSLAKDFFGEPYPGKTFIQMRRKLRRDLESIGMAYLEVLRTVDGKVAAIRPAEATMMRLVKLDNAVPVTKKVMRGGVETEFTLQERERRYVQKVGQHLVYFKEFGASRDLHRVTGEWADAGTTLGPKDRATEVIAFTLNPDVGTSYSLPRWINQLPSVLGSRKAEEANLEFFDAGGMPPAIIFVQGGTLAKTATDQLRSYLSGQAKNRSRAVVVEAQSTSGSLDSSGTVQIKVERFGSEMAKDSMYQNYDKSAEEHIRTGFRLPPLFLGKASDYNYATAVVAYMVAEAQVFGPERVEFDDMINQTIVKALGLQTVRFKSQGITLKNVENQLKSLEMLKDLVKEEDFVEEVTRIGGVSLSYDAATANATRQARQLAQQQAQQSQTPQQGPAQDGTDPALKMDVVDLAKRYAQSRGLLAVKGEFSEQDERDIDEAVSGLSGAALETFNQLLATWVFKSDEPLLTHAAGCCPR